MVRAWAGRRGRGVARDRLGHDLPDTGMASRRGDALVGARSAETWIRRGGARPLRPAAAVSERTVSVVVPVRNGSRYLDRVLAAVRAQGDVELLVVDSGSSDDSRAIARN